MKTSEKNMSNTCERVHVDLTGVGLMLVTLIIASTKLNLLGLCMLERSARQ